MTIIFKPNREVVGKMPLIPEMAREITIKREPMFFSADVTFARRNGGSLTQMFLRALPEGWENGIIDSRVHMLMPDWYPCIPGWHLDDVPRTRPDGQPDHSKPGYMAEHICCIMGDASKTEFLDSIIGLKDVKDGVVYEQWNKDINFIIEHRRAATSFINEGDLVKFGWGDFHRGTAATKNGFRWFIRITRYTERKIHNEIRMNANVYMKALDAGW